MIKLKLISNTQSQVKKVSDRLSLYITTGSDWSVKRSSTCLAIGQLLGGFNQFGLNLKLF